MTYDGKTYGPGALNGADSTSWPRDACPDCGREFCTGEDCYWPDEAGIQRPTPWIRSSKD